MTCHAECGPIGVWGEFEHTHINEDGTCIHINGDDYR